MPKLYLIPNSITDQPDALHLTRIQSLSSVRLFFVEEPKSARRLLKAFDPSFPLNDCQFFELSEHTSNSQLKEYTALLSKADAGIISESGVPCVADPGHDLVLAAHRASIEVVPLSGPSSIIMALMSSGLSGQQFSFNGYVPKDENERRAWILDLQKISRQKGYTQIFMDTPYRNQKLFEELLHILSPKTLLCVAQGIGYPESYIKTQSIQEWQKTNICLPKLPALFIIKLSE